MKTLTAFGTRPEAIKMAPVLRELNKREIKNRIVVTAQHREMLDQVLEIFSIKPHHDLNIMEHNQDIFDITIRVLEGMKKILLKEKPDIVFVHGDTTTTMATSLSAFYLNIPVAHVEAGLRTNNIYSPFPEEVNRHITSIVTKYHFAPTKIARKNLLKENVSPDRIYITGNTVIDSLYWGLKIIKKKKMDDKIKKYYESITMTNFFKKKIVLITGHRRENFGDKFRNIFSAYKELSQKYKKTINFVFPVHLNPNVKKMALDVLKGIDNFFMIKPEPYLNFIYLMSKAHIIITDSGGIQEEAPSLGKPVLVTRDTTERPEAVDAGTVKLVGSDKESIINEFIKLNENSEAYNMMSTAHNPYGDGQASKRIIDTIFR